jgi:hypothetical protein
LHGLGQATYGFCVAFGAEFHFLFEKSYFHHDKYAGVSGGLGFLKNGKGFGYTVLVVKAALVFLPIGSQTNSAFGNTLNGGNYSKG